MGFAIQPSQKGAAMIEMASYEEGRMAGMMVREEMDHVVIGNMILINDCGGNIHCFRKTRDQNIPYMVGGGRGGVWQAVKKKN